MCGECLQCLGHTEFDRALTMCAFPVYTAHAPGCSAGELSNVGPGLCAVPRSKPLSFRFSGTSQRHRLIWVCVLCPSQVQAAQEIMCLETALSQVCGASYHLPGPNLWFPGCATRAPSHVCCVSLLGSWSLTATLLVYVSQPQSQEDLDSSCESAHNLVEDAISGVEIAPCLLALAVPHLPLCLQWGEGPARSGLALLWYSLIPLFCDQAGQCLRLEFFMGKFSLSLFFCFSLSLAVPHFALLAHVSSFRLSSGHSGPVLTLSMQPVSSCSAPDHCRWTWASGILLQWELPLGLYLWFFSFFSPPSYVALWYSETLHRPAGERVSWCLETSPASWLPPWDRSPSLNFFFRLFIIYILSYLL